MSNDFEFDLTIDREELNRIAPALLDTLREFVQYGMCRQGNASERKSLAEKVGQLSAKAMRDYPTLKLNHAFAKTIVVDTEGETA